jgi:acyl-[acyl carrier protein]--UDP-N-acetylglucosamine O-acyltransferase
MNLPKNATDDALRPHLFIAKLAQMVNNQGNAKAICWTMDGEGVLINDKQCLKKEVLPAYFAKQKYESFLRHLNLFGFKRQFKNKTDHYEAIYKHPSFLRD